MQNKIRLIYVLLVCFLADYAFANFDKISKKIDKYGLQPITCIDDSCEFPRACRLYRPSGAPKIMNRILAVGPLKLDFNYDDESSKKIAGLFCYERFYGGSALFIPLRWMRSSLGVGGAFDTAIFNWKAYVEIAKGASLSDIFDRWLVGGRATLVTGFGGSGGGVRNKYVQVTERQIHAGALEVELAARWMKFKRCNGFKYSVCDPDNYDAKLQKFMLPNVEWNQMGILENTLIAAGDGQSFGINKDNLNLDFSEGYEVL